MYIRGVTRSLAPAVVESLRPPGSLRTNMETNCPSCGKKLTIPDPYAGQLMRCPLCNDTFTAPPLSTSPQFGDTRGGSSPLATARDTPPSSPTKPTTDFSVPLSEPSPPSPLRQEPVRRFSVVLHPRVIQWLVPACLWLIFIL